eukprot:scaffold1457_cov118-Isochrysis_galbana.AAC.1
MARRRRAHSVELVNECVETCRHQRKDTLFFLILGCMRTRAQPSAARARQSIHHSMWHTWNTLTRGVFGRWLACGVPACLLLCGGGVQWQ